MDRKELYLVIVILGVLLLAFIVGKAGITGNAIVQVNGLSLFLDQLDYQPGDYLTASFVVLPELEGKPYQVYSDNILVQQGTTERVNEIRFMVPGKEGLYTLRVLLERREVTQNFDVIS